MMFERILPGPEKQCFETPFTRMISSLKYKWPLRVLRVACPRTTFQCVCPPGRFIIVYGIIWCIYMMSLYTSCLRFVLLFTKLTCLVMLSQAVILLLFFPKQPCKSLSNQLTSEQNSDLVVKICAL